MTRPEDLEEETPEDVVLDTLTRWTASFDAGDWDVEERRRYWSQRIPAGLSGMLARLFGQVALDGRQWSQVELRLEEAEACAWPPEKAWSQRRRSLASLRRAAHAPAPESQQAPEEAVLR